MSICIVEFFLRKKGGFNEKQEVILADMFFAVSDKRVTRGDFGCYCSTSIVMSDAINPNKAPMVALDKATR